MWTRSLSRLGKEQLNPGSLTARCGLWKRPQYLQADGTLTSSILAFDVSKESHPAGALDRQREGRFAARAVFFVADATQLSSSGPPPWTTSSSTACCTTSPTLTSPAGRSRGCSDRWPLFRLREQRDGLFRRAFELLQRLWPHLVRGGGPGGAHLGADTDRELQRHRRPCVDDAPSCSSLLISSTCFPCAWAEVFSSD